MIGIALIAAVAFATFTCGFGVALLAGMAAGLGASGILALGEGIGKMFSSPAGTIISGSMNVFTNNLAAAYATVSTVACSNHAPAPVIADGSGNVFINGLPAARKTDAIAALGIVASTVNFDYDAAGRLVAEHGAEGTVGYAFDTPPNFMKAVDIYEKEEPVSAEAAKALPTLAARGDVNIKKLIAASENPPGGRR